MPGPVARTGPDVEISRWGRRLTLVGQSLAVGDAAPDVELVSRRGDRVRLSAYRGKVVLLSVVPELGTPVCDRTTAALDRSGLVRRNDVAVLTVSMDPWLDQQRWCDASGVMHHMTLSDYPDERFGHTYGLLVKETGYLARSVLVIDRDGVIRYIETQQEMSRMPDLAAAEAVARRLARE
ncbi:MAG: redoxin domain-containing protein [Planctomycetes bacterium]|nr:redoxin domain-containing protein [Planctomycetota bacterium]